MQNETRAGANDEWITEDEIADPTWPTVLGGRIIVRPVSIRKKSKGGILLPDKLKDDLAYLTTVGRVVAIGSTAYKEPNTTAFGWPVKVGDYISYAKFSGAKYFYRGVKIVLMNDEDALMVLDSPEDVDPNFNLMRGST